MRRLLRWTEPNALVPSDASTFEVLADRIDRGPPLVVAAVATALHAFFYGLANQFPLFRPHLLPLSPIDLAVPLWPWTVWIYFSDYLLAFVALVSLRGRGERSRFVGTFFLAVLLASAIHWLWPTVYPRSEFPPAPDTDALSTLGLHLLRVLDAPSSCFPSLHVATAFVSALAVWRERHGLGGVLLAWAGAIAVSTLTTKQHYAVDVLAGMALALVLHALMHGLGKAALRRVRPPLGPRPVR